MRSLSRVEDGNPEMGQMKVFIDNIIMIFESPLLLLIIPPVLFLILRDFFSAKREGFISLFLLVIRIVTVILLAAAVAGPVHVHDNPGVHTVYVLDRSDSFLYASDMIELIENRIQDQTGERAESMVSFAAEPVVEYGQLPLRPPLNLRGEVDANSTNIETALYTAASLIPAGSAGRVVLMSDGFENSGKAQRAAAMMHRLEIPVSTVRPDFTARDASIHRLLTPETSALGGSHKLDVHVISNHSFSGRLEFYRDQNYLGESEIMVHPGMNYFHYYYQLRETGMHTYEVYLRGSADIRPQNDYGRVSVFVPGKTKILFVSENTDSDSNAVRALHQQGFSVDRINPVSLPQDLASYMQWSCIIFDNVPAHRISYQTMILIEQFVKHLGCGFIMIGGDESFGPGGYYRTPVERVLPVDMDISSPLSTPALTLLVLVDKSGSMGDAAIGYREKIDILKQSVLSAVEVLNPYYSIGILAFDADTEWIVPVTRAENKKEITRDLKLLTPEGGTRMYPAMEEALSTLSADEAKVRHLLIISDGHVHQADYFTLAGRMSAEDITVSTVAVGEDADTELLRGIAEIGSGRFYEAKTIEEAPRIFASEAMMISRTLIFEESFFPTIYEDHSIMSGIAAMPPFRGCVLTYTKDEAQQIITGPENYPLLSVRRFGLGRSAAFTSDLSGRWSDLFMNSPDFSLFIGQLVRWSSSGAVHKALYLSHKKEGDKLRVAVELRDQTGDFVADETIRVTAVHSDHTEHTADLPQVHAGRYEGTVSLDTKGDTLVQITSLSGQYRASRMISRSYSPEFLMIPDYEQGSRLLEEISSRTGGTSVLIGKTSELDTDSLFSDQPPSRADGVPFWREIVYAALLLYIIDCMIRIVRAYRSEHPKVSRLEDDFGIQDTGAQTPGTEQRSLSFWFGREYGKKSE